MTTYFSEKTLLSAPTSRAAFSDRTAYVMAEMSKLAYFKFEGGHTVDQFIDSAKVALGDGDALKHVKLLAEKFFSHTSAKDARAVFEDVLKENSFELIDVFDKEGTQAFLCRHITQNTAILAFRGTEPTEYADIKSDINAKLVEMVIAKQTVLVHSGYWKAFCCVKDSIKEKLEDEKCKDCQLFFTGHSLGGALSTIAVKYFSSDASGACYTFGAPPIGTKDFENKLKTPLYRIVNHLDIVPNLPNPFMAFFVKGLIKLFFLILVYLRIDRIVSSQCREKINQLIIDSSRYRQIGYGSVLMGTEKNPVLRYQLGIWDKCVMYTKIFFTGGWLFKKKQMQRFFTDHSIDAYSKKLRGWAVSRKS